MNVHLCFLVCLHFPFAVTTVVRFLDPLRVSSSSELKSFLLSMYIEAPESTTNIRSSVFLETSAGGFYFHKRIERSFIIGFELVCFFSPNPTLLCGHDLLVVRFPLVFLPQTWARKGFGHEVRLF